MKPFRPFRLTSMCSAIAASLLVLGLGAGQVHADGNEILGAPSINVEPGSSAVSAGTGLHQGAGQIQLNVPAGATIQQVLLYWSARGTDIVDNLLVNGQSVSGSVIGIAGPTNPALKTRSYRADITGNGFVSPGSNTVNVAGIGVAEGVLDGASIVVIFDASSNVQYSGRSVAVAAKVAGITTRLGDTGELPVGGGFLAPKPILGAVVPDLLYSNTVTSSTVGAGGVTASKSSVDGLGLGLVNGLVSLLLGGEVLESSAVAQCTAQGAQLIGGSKLLGLKMNEHETNVAFEPNTTILDLLGLIKVVANEQVKTEAGNTGSILVNALHVSAPVLGLVGLDTDVVIASSAAGVSCVPPAPSQIRVIDGADFAFAGMSGAQGSTVKKTFSFAPVPFDRVARVHLIVGDADPVKPDAVQIFRNGVLVKTLNNTLNSSEGFEWDNDVITIPVPANSGSVSVRLLSRSTNGLTDSIVWVATVLDLPTEPPQNVYSGRATVVRADVAGLVSAVVGDTGALPAMGGNLVAEPLNIGIPLLPLTSVTAKATSVGAGEKSESTATLEGLDLGLLTLGVSVKADVIKSKAVATCSADNIASVSGGSSLAKLAINGSPITNLQANTKLNLGIAQVLINEKIVSGSGNYRAITVNALRITAPDLTGLLGSDLANVVIGHSHADILCN